MSNDSSQLHVDTIRQLIWHAYIFKIAKYTIAIKRWIDKNYANKSCTVGKWGNEINIIFDLGHFPLPYNVFPVKLV